MEFFRPVVVGEIEVDVYENASDKEVICVASEHTEYNDFGGYDTQVRKFMTVETAEKLVEAIQAAIKAAKEI